MGSGNRVFSGLGDCLKKTAQNSGFFGLYNGFGISVVGIIPYRGVYFGMFDTLMGENPYKNNDGFMRPLSTFGIAQVTAITAGYAS